MATGREDGGRVRTFRVRPTRPGPPWSTWLLLAAWAVPLTTAGVVRLARGDLLGLVAVAVVVLATLGLVRLRRLVLGLDVDATGITWRPSGHRWTWAELGPVLPRGPRREVPGVRTRTGKELVLVGMPDDDVELVRAVVGQDPSGGAEPEGGALERLLAGPDVARGDGAPPPVPGRRRAVPLVAAAAVLLLLSQLGTLFFEGTPELVASLLVVPGLALLVTAGVVAVRAPGEGHDRGDGGSPPG